MRYASQEAKDVLFESGSKPDITFTADVMYGSERRMANVPVSAFNPTWDDSGQVEFSGTVDFVFNPDDGSSMAPKEPGDSLAPFGAELVFYAHIEGLDDAIRLGVGQITEVASTDTAYAVTANQRYVTGERIRLAFKDRMNAVQRDIITGVAAPVFTDSTYREIGRLSAFPVKQNGDVTDAPVGATVAYDKDRAQAVQDLAASIGGVAFFNAYGEIELRRTIRYEVDATLALGPDGSMFPLSNPLSSERVYNVVAVTGEANGEKFTEEVVVTEGPLAATVGSERTPYHRVVEEREASWITSRTQARAHGQAVLAQVSRPRGARIAVDTVLNPLLEVGDVIQVVETYGETTVRAVRMRISRITYGVGRMSLAGVAL